MKTFWILMLVLTGFYTRSNAQATPPITDDKTMAADSSMEIMPIIADRPDKSESPYVVPKGYCQLELGFSIEDTEPGFVYSYPKSLVKFGITNNFELRFFTDYVTIQKEPNPDLKGFTPLSVGIKAKLGEQKGILPKMSFVGHLRIPGVVSDELETKYLSPILVLAFDHKISPVVNLGYNLGVEWDGLSPDPNFLYALSLGINITDRLGIYGEGYGRVIQQEDDDIEFRADAGITYLIGNDFLLDVSAGKGITDNAPERYVELGFSYRFKL